MLVGRFTKPLVGALGAPDVEMRDTMDGAGSLPGEAGIEIYATIGLTLLLLTGRAVWDLRGSGFVLTWLFDDLLHCAHRSACPCDTWVLSGENRKGYNCFKMSRQISILFENECRLW